LEKVRRYSWRFFLSSGFHGGGKAAALFFALGTGAEWLRENPHGFCQGFWPRIVSVHRLDCLPVVVSLV